ncbi:hypothetical protein [Mesorhizobium japonicum]|uniref:hypothetical protein n=1 Tax=Mesorhizobium japonicum TaxID=2066070 RepID=UPI001FCBB103|nr:hypothetical protein [Mesorhizobium japonicum]
MTTTQKTANVTSDSLGLKDSGQFLQPGSTGNGSGGQPSLHHLIGLAAGSVTTDLLNILNTIKGFGHQQNQPSRATTDQTLDATKHGTGYASTDHTAKTTLKDLLKPHE